MSDDAENQLAGVEDVLYSGAVWAEVPADLERRVLDLVCLLRSGVEPLRPGSRIAGMKHREE